MKLYDSHYDCQTGKCYSEVVGETVTYKEKWKALENKIQERLDSLYDPEKVPGSDWNRITWETYQQVKIMMIELEKKCT
jgi:hypothetical protein